MPKPIVIITCATIPVELANEWLQHLRDFDVAHADCHFEVMAQSDLPTEEMIEVLRIDPPLTHTTVVPRK